MFHSAAVERLEDRRVMAAPDILNLPSTLTLQNGAPLQIPLDGVDADGDELSYTITIEPQFQDRLQAQLRSGRSVEIEVNHASSGANDPAFTGSMILKLFEDLAPRTTDHFLTLAQRNPSFFEGIIFHRVAQDSVTGENFVIQGGDPTGTGTGGSDLPNFDDEFHVDLQHTSAGILSMAKSDDDTNDSQFFITGEPTRHLDFNHSIFGLLVEGDDIRQKITEVAVDGNDKPVSPVTMTDVTVFEDEQNGVFTLKTLDTSFTGTVNVTVTVSDGSEQVSKTIAVNVVADTSDAAPFLDPIPPITTRANTPVQVTLTARDADGGAATVFLASNLGNANLDATIDPNSGILTVTPKNGISGVQQVRVAVQSANSNNFDIQDVPVYVSPAAPSAPDLQPEFDTGSSPTDNVTRLDNSSQGNRLNFVVGGVVAGAQVQLFDGNALIGQGTVAAGATSITITTNGTVDLTDGQHSITAVQTLLDQNVNVGNFTDQVDLASQASSPLALTVDTAPSAITSTAPLTATVGAQYSYNVQADGEGTTGFTYSFVVSPTGATIDAATGVISWIPSTAQVGNQNFTVRASDQAGNPVEQSFTVNVTAATQQPPTITDIGNKNATVGELLTFTVTATDPDSPPGSIRFSLGPGSPADAAINDITGVFTWTPTAAQQGVQNIVVRATDGAATSEKPFQVTVAPRPITFEVIDGDLVIPGTAGADNVTIRGTAVPGQFDVSGSLGAETVNGVTRGIRLDLLGGNDSVVLNNVLVAGQIVINTGDGDDVVRLGDDAKVSSAQNLSILLGAGNDQLHIRRVYVGADITIDGEAGNDTIMVIGSAEGSQFVLGGSSVGATTMRGGDGDDAIRATFSFIVGPWKVDGGAGNDGLALAMSATSGDVTVSGGDGNDMLLVDTNYFVTSLTVNGNAGHDSLSLKNSIMLQAATLLGGDGNDNVEVANINARGLMFSHGAGQDSAAVRTSLLQNLFADLGDGDDILVMQSNKIFGSAEADGGLGLGDRLVDSGNLMRPARKRRFENFG